jgi:glycosyltransferase involved in cell wall biosynthesis
VTPLPLHLAIHVPGCAVEQDGGVAVNGRVGPLIEGVAELFATTTIVGYEPPVGARSMEDRTDFVVLPRAGELRLLSLGPRGSVRDYRARRRRVAPIVEDASRTWDVLFLPLVNRRVGLVWGASRCRRVFAQIGGHTPTVVLRSPMSVKKRIWSWTFAQVAELQYWRVARAGLFFVNGEDLVRRYRRVAPHLELVRDSARRQEHAHVEADRMASGPVRLLFAGRVTGAKGILETVDVLAALRAGSMPDATLDVVGSGDALEAAQRHAAALGLDDAVTWHGWVPPGADLFAIFRRCDVLITLSLAESLPKTVWEAMAHSVLVVATPVGALPDAFEDGSELLFVPVGDVDAAVRAVERLQADGDLRARLLENGRKSAAGVTVEAIAEHMVERVTTRWPELLAADTRRRVLLLSPNLTPPAGGVQRTADDVATSLADEVVRVIGASAERRADDRFVVIQRRGAGPLAELSAQVRFTVQAWKHARDSDVDLVHALTWRAAAPLLLVRRRRRPPYVLHCQGAELQRPQPLPLRLARRRVLERAASIVAISEHTADLARRVGARGEITMVYPPLRAFPSEVAARAPADVTRLLSVGRLVPHKGHDAALRLVAALPSDLPVHLTIVGSGPERPALEAMVRDLDLGARVSFAGAVDEHELDALYRAADVFVLLTRAQGSEVEGFGIVFLEAAAYALASIAGRAGGTADAVVDGVTGFVVGTAEEGAAAVERLLRDRDLMERMGHAGRERARGFVLEEFAAKMRAVYAEAAGDAR